MSLFTGALAAGLIGAIGGGASVAAAAINSHASGDAADKASAANASALDFNKQQAETEYRNQETTRKANWDQRVAQQHANNKIRQALGLAPIDIPAYVPSVDPAFTGTPPPNTGSLGHVGGAPAASAPPQPAQVGPARVAQRLQPPMQPVGGMSLGAMAGAPIQVRGRDGQLLTFPTQQQADVYKQEQGIV